MTDKNASQYYDMVYQDKDGLFATKSRDGAWWVDWPRMEAYLSNKPTPLSVDYILADTVSRLREHINQVTREEAERIAERDSLSS